jgi:predicted 2-oxoglutarate/Fe(II)-dependent dioxygenase YbiX
MRQSGFWTIDDVLTRAECAAEIERIEALGPTVAPITTGRGFELRPDLRNNTRVMFDDAPLAQRLFEAVRSTLPALPGRTPVGANERLRCYRYEAGQYFAPHFDGAFMRSRQERSLLTFIVYLNECEAGGETGLLDLDCAVAPKAGRALLFNHHLLHEGARVHRGLKYALRSDLMYRRDGAARG